MIRLVVKRIAAMVVILLVLTAVVFTPPEGEPHRSGPRLPRGQRLQVGHRPRERGSSATTSRSSTSTSTTSTACSTGNSRVAADPAPGGHRPRQLPSGHRGADRVRPGPGRWSWARCWASPSAGRWRGAGIFRFIMFSGASAPAVPAGTARDPASSAATCTGYRPPVTPAMPTRRPDRPAWSSSTPCSMVSSPCSGTASAT